MAVSKKLRFEIFRRDRFACRYCGKSAMDGAVLEVDHVIPRVDGGGDIPTNLVTACDACNSGKSDTALESRAVQDVPEGALRPAIPGAQDDSSPWDVDLPAWVENLEMDAAIAFSHGWGAGPLSFGEHSVSVVLAIGTGRTRDEIVQASELAGQAHSHDIEPHLPSREEVQEDDFETAEYTAALETLSHFVPGERWQLIWHARLAAGEYQPTRRELIRAAASVAKRLLEEHGRVTETLIRYLDNLPDGQGSLCLLRATAEWDGVWQGAHGHSAWECQQEVLELAVSRALKAEATV